MTLKYQLYVEIQIYIYINIVNTTHTYSISIFCVYMTHVQSSPVQYDVHNFPNVSLVCHSNGGDQPGASLNNIQRGLPLFFALDGINGDVKVVPNSLGMAAGKINLNIDYSINLCVDKYIYILYIL